MSFTAVRPFARKRKRATNKESGKESNDEQSKIPVINGVPPIVVPHLLEAVKLQKKYISQQHKLPQSDLSNPLSHQSPEHSDGNRNRSVHDAIFARIHASHTTKGPLQELQLDAQRSLESFLCEINKHTNDVTDEMFDDEELPSGCAVGCLEFLSDLIKDGTVKIILRHAALVVCRGLLQQRHDCRIIYTKNIKDLVDAIGDADQHLDACPKIGNTEQMVVYQKEGLKMIKDLSKRFRSIEPTLVIAGRYLEEQKGISLVAGTNSALKRKTNAGMIELRRTRDVALKFADIEAGRIRKLLGKVDSCFDVLVQRFGHRSASIDKVLPAQVKDETEDGKGTDLLIVEEEDQSDDEDIGWEDGDNKDSESVQSDNDEDHLCRVERTLSVMKQTGALQNDGTLDVTFGVQSNHTSPAPSSEDIDTNHTTLKARELLSKCLRKLSKRHSRISLWIDALVSADNMIDSNRIRATIQSTDMDESQVRVSSVIILPESIRNKKPLIMKALTDCKSAISTAFLAAAKIGIYDKSNCNRSAPLPQLSDSSNALYEPASQSWQDALGVTATRPCTSMRQANVQQSKRNRSSNRDHRLQIRLRKK
eukprot:scaffold10260_cov266-Chaetoceros_neogracile.AAC.18